MLRMSCSILLLLLLVRSASADEGKPLAVRWWGQAFVTIETYWGLTVAIDPYATRIGYEDPQVSADVVLVTHEHGDHNNVDLVQGHPIVLRGLGEDGSVRRIDQTLDRRPNEDHPSVTDTTARVARSPHAVRMRTVPSFHDDVRGADRGRNAMWLIEADGVRILHAGDLGQSTLIEQQLAAIGDLDILLLPVGGVYTIDGQQAAEIVSQLNPRYVVPIHYKTDDLRIGLEPIDGFLAALPDSIEQRETVGNTLAVSARRNGSTAGTVATLDSRPWSMSAELAELIDSKERASAASQEVFRALSINQLNHRPSNGTHTPRWNAEHMMGMEMLFFSSIFSHLDPEIERIEIQPQQMPDDYVFGHPDWSGSEEARQMQRVQNFTRRFSYLLKGIDLDTRPEGSPWTLRGLLRQMHNHYGEHTGNVKKKFDLPDWPGKKGDH